MLNDGILKVVEETQVRGTVERTYALAFDLNSDFEAILAENSGTLYMQVFMQYLLGFAKQFREYSNDRLRHFRANLYKYPFYRGDCCRDIFTELYTNMRYLQYGTLQKLGLGHFDSWASSFGETQTAIDIACQL